MRLALAFVFAVAAARAGAVTVSGKVLAPNGSAAASVNVDALDANGISIPLTNDVTSAQGTYSIAMPAGTYALVYKAPAASGWASVEVKDVAIAGASVTRPDVHLPTGFTITGAVKDASGNVVAGADIDMLDCATLEAWPTPSDNTSSLGRYSVVVPAGNWIVQVEPAVGVRLAVVNAPCATLNASGERPLITLPAAVQVSGTVHDIQGAAIVDANTSFYDATGRFVDTVADHSDGSGVFRTMVVPGAYEVRVRPPAGLALVAAGVNVTAAQDADVGIVTLVPGRRITGLVKDSRGAVVAAVDTDWTLPGGDVTTPSDNTDSTGRYSVIVPDGTYIAGFDPPATLRLAGRELTGLVVSADATLPDVLLSDAGLVRGRVLSPSLQPVVDANTVTREETSQALQRTPDDHSGTDGRFVAALLPGTYEVSIYPRVGSPLAATKISNVTIASATQDVDLGDIVLPTGVALTGRLVTQGGSPVAGVDLDVLDPATGARWPTASDNSGADGRFAVRVPSGTWDLSFVPAAPLVTRTLRGRTVTSTTDVGDVVLFDASIDPDADGVVSASDNCPSIANESQADLDGDSIGDACDRCRVAPDPSQVDSDGDGVSDACAFTWGDILGDGRVTVSDVVKALRVVVGLETLTSDQFLRGNVAPATVAAGTPETATPTLAAPRVLDVSDVVMLLRFSVGLSQPASPR